MHVSKEIRQPDLFGNYSIAICCSKMSQNYLLKTAISICMLVETTSSKRAIPIPKVKMLAVN
uniref:Uncharacterized protein n=1 Tax=Lotus japonicus TaxID=34305 RepID=I3T7A7_LOTJA|nr:unknown [Lotus japonicus]